MLPGFRPQQPAASEEQSGAPALPTEGATPSFPGLLPWHRPVMDVLTGRAVGHELCYPSGFDRPLYPDGDYSREQFERDYAWRRDWVLSAAAAGLAASGRWLLMPVNSSLAGRHPETLAGLLAQSRLRTLGTPLSTLRVVIQFDAALHATDAAFSLALIRVFRSQGFAIAINGFGDGFDSRQDLIEAAPDLLRLSPELTRGLEEDRHRRSIVSALVGMAQELNVGLIADEVDTPALAARLLTLGVGMQTGRVHGDPAPFAPPPR